MKEIGLLGWLAGAAVAIVASVLALAVGGSAGAHAFGYAVASVVAFSAVGLFRRAARTAFVARGYVPPRAADVACVAILMVGFVLTLAHAWLIARRYA